MQKIIFLVDMNAFFIGCEMSRNPGLKGKPAAVAGDPERRSGIILAANYEARGFGVKTTMTLQEAKRRCPALITVPPDHSFYSSKSRQVMGILSRYTPVIQQNSIDEAWLDMTGCIHLHSGCRRAAESIMKDILDELDLWCSIGISENKFLAKMASEMKKPRGITELWLSDVPSKLWPLPVRDMYGIGKQTEKKLFSLGLLTIGDLAACSPDLLKQAFGKYGEELHHLANGKDFSEVVENPQHESRSISRSTTLPDDIVDLEQAKAVLLRLAEEVGSEARSEGFKGKTVFIVVKYNDFSQITRQKSVTPTYLTRDIYRTGAALLAQNWDRRKPVRLLGIGIGSSHSGACEQMSIFDIAGNTGSEDRVEKLEMAVDSIRQRFGSEKVFRAKIMPACEKHDRTSSPKHKGQE